MLLALGLSISNRVFFLVAQMKIIGQACTVTLTYALLQFPLESFLESNFRTVTYMAGCVL